MKSKVKGDIEDEEERLKVKEKINKFGQSLSEKQNQEYEFATP